MLLFIEPNLKKTLQHNTSINTDRLILTKLYCTCKVCIAFAIYTPPDDGPRGVRKYLGTNQLREIYWPITAE